MSKDGTTIRRRRECLSCNYRYTTYEQIERTELRVVKKDGTREALNREKLFRGLVKACEKRPVSMDRLDRAVEEILSELHKDHLSEVPSHIIGAKVMDKLGVATQLLAPGDIFPALQLGTIDATEFSMPSSDESFGFYQVAKYYYFPGWHQPASLGDLFINMDVWNGLSAQHKKIIELACGDMIRETLARGEASQAPAMRRMRDKHGVKIKYWPREILDAYKTAWDEVVDEESAANPKFKKVYASYTKFREDFKLWGDNAYLK